MFARLAPVSQTLVRAPVRVPILQRSLSCGAAPALRPLSSLPPTPRSLSQARSASTQAGAQGGGLRISHLFIALAGGAILITTYGILEWYSSFRVWPEAIRTPLKKAIKARNHDDTEKAEKYFLEAIAAAHSLPVEALAPEPLKKMSGLYITLAAMLEPIQPIRAFVTLRDAIALFGDGEQGSVSGYSGEPLSDEDATRVIGLAQKMGQIATRLGGAAAPPPFPASESIGTFDAREIQGGAAAQLLLKDGEESKEGKNAREEWDIAAEKYLSQALTAMLKMGLAHRPPPQGDKEGENRVEAVNVGRDVRLPHEGEGEGRVNRRGLGMTMEALAEVYGRRGRPDLAGQLILQAITTLLPPQAEAGEITPADRCQAAMLMTSVSAYALAPRTPPAIKAARSWSLRALQEAEAATKAAGWATGPPVDAAQATCQRAASVALFNLGMLAEMDGKVTEAIQHFNHSLQTARDAGFAEGRREAAEALRRAKGRS